MQIMKALITRKRDAEPLPEAKSERDPRDARFLTLLRVTCAKAAAIGAVSAIAEALPGMGKALGLVSGGLLDAGMLAKTQRDLIDHIFELYELRMPAPARNAMLDNLAWLGAGAGAAGDTFSRGLLRRGIARIGGTFAQRTLPLAAIGTSAFANAAATYAIGQRARTFARLGEVSNASLADAVRSFTGIDERRIARWALAACKDTLAATVAIARKRSRT
jgi:hypothetical protein